VYVQERTIFQRFNIWRKEKNSIAQEVYVQIELTGKWQNQLVKWRDENKHRDSFSSSSDLQRHLNISAPKRCGNPHTIENWITEAVKPSSPNCGWVIPVHLICGEIKSRGSRQFTSRRDFEIIGGNDRNIFIRPYSRLCSAKRPCSKEWGTLKATWRHIRGWVPLLDQYRIRGVNNNSCESYTDWLEIGAGYYPPNTWRFTKSLRIVCGDQGKMQHDQLSILPRVYPSWCRDHRIKNRSSGGEAIPF